MNLECIRVVVIEDDSTVQQIKRSFMEQAPTRPGSEEVDPIQS